LSQLASAEHQYPFGDLVHCITHIRAWAEPRK
jgi:hypothetical protein